MPIHSGFNLLVNTLLLVVVTKMNSAPLKMNAFTVCWTSLSSPSGHSHVSLYISMFLHFFHPQPSLLLYSDAEDVSALTYDLTYYHSLSCSGLFVPRYNQYSCLFFSTLMLRIGPFVPRSCPYRLWASLADQGTSDFQGLPYSAHCVSSVDDFFLPFWLLSPVYEWFNWPGSPGFAYVFHGAV